jgi:hypothetical protein
MHDTLIIPGRFNGPPGAGNGGYVSGLLARHASAQTGWAAGSDVEVTLRQLVPLDRPLGLARDGARVLLQDGDTLVAEATHRHLELQAPAPPSLAVAEVASQNYAGSAGSSLPTCFVCGTERQAGDGLRLFPGRVPDRDLVAAPWTPDASLASAEGWISPEIVWSVLDCPGAWAIDPPRSVLLGRMAVHLCAPVQPGMRCVVMGWVMRQDRRKHFTGTALFTEAGEVLGMASAIWIELQPR